MPDHDHTLTDEQIFCLQGCRSYKQYYKMRHGFEADTCAFCQLDRTFNKVLWEDEFAMLWKVPDEYLRPELALHALVVPKFHRRFEADLSISEVMSIHMAKVFIRKELGYTGGMSHVREGDMRLNAGTVPHLHYNIFQPDPIAIQKQVDAVPHYKRREGEKVEVRILVYKDPGDNAAGASRAADFSTYYEAGEVP